VDQVVREFGRIDILVNDAAYNTWIPFRELQDLGLEDWTKILRVNLTGPFVCSKAVAPLMKRQGRGRIINVTSIAGLNPMGSSIAYAVSKAALIHLTRCLAVALAPEVLVNSVAPGVHGGHADERQSGARMVPQGDFCRILRRSFLTSRSL
jgi:3-oxoacyl-[acyl-carrier protein] reductase